MRGREADDRLLDNVVWHALRGPLARFARPSEDPAVVRFDPDVNLFGGVDRVDDAAWRRIERAVGPEGDCALFRDEVGAVPAGWETHFRGVCVQMVAGTLPEKRADAARFERLTQKDVPDMLALTELTEPGPFFPRTYELGRYVGLRQEGRLVAMAGERFRVPGFVEVSAVCTHPDVRGQGLGSALTLDVAESIRAGGDEAFLHVLDTNEDAIRVYHKLGFEPRRKTEVVFAQWHGADWRAQAEV